MTNLTNREQNLKRSLNTMAREVRKLPAEVFQNDVVLTNIHVLRKYG